MPRTDLSEELLEGRTESGPDDVCGCGRLEGTTDWPGVSDILDREDAAPKVEDRLGCQ